ncbi:putative adenine/cytosine DNA methyltransferase [Helicobacter pylori R046Wa]|nr:DNA cytosine methyltransferase [Helicobacter pylori]EKE89123.1 putative adenine/cytosine DNA methyltransferase [Helicobacter pylori R046Wa]
MLLDKALTYVSLFSGAGVGCYGLLEEGFECVATNEILDSILKPLNKN